LTRAWSATAPPRRRDTVASNPVIYGLDSYNKRYWSGDGPYRTRGDAELARSTISACPKEKSDDEKK
jgi:hypothetical protein